MMNYIFTLDTQIEFSDAENKEAVINDLKKNFSFLFSDAQLAAFSDVVSNCFFKGGTLGDFFNVVVSYYDRLCLNSGVFHMTVSDILKKEVTISTDFSALYVLAARDVMVALRAELLSARKKGIKSFTANSSMASPYISLCNNVFVALVLAGMDDGGIYKSFEGIHGRFKDNQDFLNSYNDPKGLSDIERIVSCYAYTAYKVGSNTYLPSFDVNVYAELLNSLGSPSEAKRLFDIYLKDLQPLRHLNSFTDDGVKKAILAEIKSLV